MKIRIRKTSDINVVELDGRLTIDGGDAELRQCFSDLLGAGERLFVLDLRSLGRIDSAGLGEVIACHKAARDAGGNIRIVLDSEGRIGEFFTTAHLNRVIDLFPDDHAAILGFVSR